MSTHNDHTAGERLIQQRRKSAATLGAFLIGIPLGLGILALVNIGPMQNTLLAHYVSNPVEYAEVMLFALGLGALLSKCLAQFAERAAFSKDVLPRWDGKPVSDVDAGPLLDYVNESPRSVQNTYLVRRISAVLGFVHHRGSAEDLDDQIRNLSDTDALGMESSYSFLRFVTWAIPILGFLGTVLGITAAIAGVTPEVLERSLNTVTDGLAVAFDTTALALCLTMVLMFLNFLVERTEQSLLERVDETVENELAHRFERTGADGGELMQAVRQQSREVLKATEEVVHRQADVWAVALAKAEKHWAEDRDQFQIDITTALQSAFEQQTQRMADWEHQMQRNNQTILNGFQQLAEMMAQMVQGKTQLEQMQHTLRQNLSVLAESGSFDQAVQSLTAAIHLLTARASRPPLAA